MWYISFHGGDGGVDNLLAYHDSGKPEDSPNVLPIGGSNPVLKELRAFQIIGDNLYVINAYKKFSQVLCYTRAADAYVFSKILASKDTIPAIFHPYDLGFDHIGNCYLSSQDSNVVTQITPDGKAGSIAPFLTLLHLPEPFLAGTFVASSVGALPEIAAPTPPNVAAPQGLLVSYTDDSQTRVLNSVRGVLHYKGNLYVCDEVADAVKVYDGFSGQWRGQIAGKHLNGPVQLLLDAKEMLYIGSSKNDSVVRYNLAQGNPAGVVEAEKFIDGKVEHISGMDFDAAGNFYAAERKAKKIKRFKPDGSDGKDFITDLPDEPEFIKYIASS